MPTPQNLPTSKERILNLLNQANNTAFTFDHLEFGVPQPASVAATRNTTLTVTFNETTSFQSTKTVTYNRWDLAVLFAAVNTSFILDPSWSTTHDLIDVINTRFSLSFDTTDLYNDPLDLSDFNNISVVLRAKPNSFVVIGQCEFSILGVDTSYVPEYNQTLDNLSSALLDMDIGDSGFATLSSGTDQFALRPMAFDNADVYSTSFSDVGLNYGIDFPTDGGWQVTIAMTGANAKQLVEDNRVRLVMFDQNQTEGVSAIFNLKHFDNGNSVGFTYAVTNSDGSTFPFDNIVAYGSDGHTAILSFEFLYSHLIDHLPSIGGTFGEYALGPIGFELQIMPADSEDTVELYALPFSVSAAHESVGGLGDGGFVVAASSRTFLADRFSDALIVTDIEAPTGFPVMVAGKNGEVFAFKNNDDDTALILRHSQNRGESWQEQIFPGYLIRGIRAAFFKGHVYIATRQSMSWDGTTESQWNGDRVYRLDYDETFALTHVLDVPGVDAMSATDDYLIVADSLDLLHRTTDGVSWQKLPFNDVTFNDQLWRIRNCVFNAVGSSIYGCALIDHSTGSYPATWVTFVRNSEGDITVRDPSFYPGYSSSSNFYWTFGYADGYENGGMIVIDVPNVGPRWIVAVDSTMKVGGAMRTRGDVFYSDDQGQSWTYAINNSLITAVQFFFDGERVLMSGRPWNVNSGGAQWAALSLDFGDSWEFDSDITSQFGENRTEILVAAARTQGSEIYPSPVNVPPLDPVEIAVNSNLNVSYFPKVRTLTDQGFIVYDNIELDLDNNMPRTGIYKLTSSGTLAEDFDADLVAGAAVNVQIVNGVSETGNGLILVGNFISVGGTSRNGYAVVDKHTGALDTDFPNVSFLDDEGQAASLEAVTVCPSGKFYIWGQFVSVDGHATFGLARFLADGSVDTSFVSPVSHANGIGFLHLGELYGLSGDRVLVLGNGHSLNRPLVIKADGSVDGNFRVSGGFANTAVVEPDGGFTLFGAELAWNGAGSEPALQVFDIGDDWVHDSTFVVRNDEDHKPFSIDAAVRLSTGVYCVSSGFITADNDWKRHKLSFLNARGKEIEYSEVRFEEPGSGPGSMAVNANDRILAAGQFSTLYQSTYPRTYGLYRSGLFMFYPVGAQQLISGGDPGPDENSPPEGGGPSMLEGAGFFISQESQVAKTTDLTTLTAVTDPEAPYLSRDNKALAICGERNDLFTFQSSTNGLTINYSEDGGTTFPYPPLDLVVPGGEFASFRLEVEEAVFFKACVYFVFKRTVNNFNSGVARVSVNRDVNGEFVSLALSQVLEFADPFVSKATIATNGTHMVVAEYGPSLHITQDGVEWEREQHLHPWPDAGGTPGNNVVHYRAIALSGTTLVALVTPENSDGTYRPLAIMRGTIGDTNYTYSTPIDYGTLNGITDWDVGYNESLIKIDTQNGPRLLLSVNESYDYNNYPGESTVGDVWMSDDLGVSFTRVLENSGVGDGRFVDDGTNLIYHGYINAWTNGTTWAAFSADRGSTWTLDTNATSIFGESQSSGVVAAAIRTGGAVYDPPAAPPIYGSQLRVFGGPKMESMAGSVNISQIAQASSGDYYVVGNFFSIGQPNPFDQTPAHATQYIGRFLANGDPDTSFTLTSANTLIDNVLPTADGLVVSGYFGLIADTACQGLARLTETGSFDTDFHRVLVENGAGNTVRALKLTPSLKADGSYYMYGSQFDLVDGVARTGLFRVALDGTLDTSFNVSGVTEGGGLLNVEFAQALSEDQVLIFGNFDQGRVLIVNGSGQITAIVPSITGPAAGVSEVFVNYGGAEKCIIVFGGGLVYNGAEYGALKLSVDGTGPNATFTVDEDFSCQVSFGVRKALGIHAPGGFLSGSTGDILLLGYFELLNGNVVQGIARINWVTGLTSTAPMHLRVNGSGNFVGGFLQSVNDAVVAGGMQVMTGGVYPVYGPAAVNAIAAIDLAPTPI